jgi:hypothetical protein
MRRIIDSHRSTVKSLTTDISVEMVMSDDFSRFESCDIIVIVRPMPLFSVSMPKLLSTMYVLGENDH